MESLLQALDAAGGTDGLSHIATVVEKADAPAICELAAHLNVPLEAVAKEALPGVPVETQSEKSVAMYGTGSLSEAVALISAGPGARLVVARTISQDSMATCAIAEVAP